MYLFFSVDFFQLILACCQEKVFAYERTAPNTNSVANVSPSRTIIQEARKIKSDFMRNKTWLDMFKVHFSMSYFRGFIFQVILSLECTKTDKSVFENPSSSSVVLYINFILILFLYTNNTKESFFKKYHLKLFAILIVPVLSYINNRNGLELGLRLRLGLWFYVRGVCQTIK